MRRGRLSRPPLDRTGAAGAGGSFCLVAAVVLVACLLCGSALAAAAAGGAADEAKPARSGRTEFAGAPLVSFNTDLGLGLGGFAALTRVAPGADPWRWRLAASVVVYVRRGDDGRVVLPLQSYLLRFDRPGLADGRLRLQLTAGFVRRPNSGWFGLGNESVEQRPWEDVDADAAPAVWRRARRFQHYDRLSPLATGRVRVALAEHVELWGGLSASWNLLTVYEGSRLEQDLAAASPVRLVGLSPHLLLVPEVGLLYDSRDDEVAPDSGLVAEFSVRGGGALGEDPAGFVGLDGQLRVYLPLVPGRVIVAGRLIGDVLMGDPPIYELSMIGGQDPVPAPGGSRSLRGVPVQRYHGKVKLLANLELRTTFLRFKLRRRQFVIGGVGFVDAGRVWTELAPRPELDGHGLGVKVGLGGGARFRWGEAFMLRVDGAWSPDGGGFYFDVNHLF